MHSIRIKITAITVMAILASILSVFAASFWIIRSETDQDSVRMMNLIGEDTRKSLEKYFDSIEQAVEITANTAIEDLDTVFLVENGALSAAGAEKARTPEEKDALDAYLHSHCAAIQSLFAGVADYTQGVSAYYYCISPEISQDERGFYYMKIGKAGFIEQEPLHVDSLTPRQSLDATWYEAAVSRGRPAWIGPYISDARDEIWICSYFVPIYKAGMLIGVMGMDIPCDTLVAQISDVRIYNTGYVSLLDENRRVIYHPELPVGGDLNELGLSVSMDLLYRESSGDALFRYKAGSEERQISFCTLANGMKLLSVVPAREINAPWIQLIRAILMIAAVVVVVSVVVLLLLIGAITLPLKQLTQASSRLANADYAVDLNYRGRDEIGTLTEAFKRMRDQIRQYIADLNHQLYHDKLTDLPNMRHFFALAGELKDRLLADGQRPVMLYFDIIGLRHYNRQYGFEKGDRLILAFADILRRQFGERRVCRFDGDHFAAVTDEARMEEEIQAVLHECETVMDGNRIPVRVGIYPNRLENVDVNVACDRAKYSSDQNKGSLASTVTCFTEEMLKKGEAYRHIINNLDRALAEGWVRVYYQPIIRSSDGRICDEEALARWIDPELGFLSPAFFIPALEESKLIYKLDLYVLEQILAKMKQQAEAGVYVVPQSVNLSRVDFESCDVVEEIRRRVDGAGIDRSMITVEITESVIGSDFEFIKEQVDRFRQLGFPVWMDDFGSGYSSMNVLQQIHFDLIKFDMGFMQRFNEGDESKIILTELMNMAISLGMETVCEGVEQAEQVEFLREIGCTRIQGYYYGKPMPFEGNASVPGDGKALEYENPAEAEYYAAIGRINLYDISAMAAKNDESLAHYFNTLPMCIMEVDGTRAHYNRCNRSYRDFLERFMGVPYDAREVELTAPVSEIDGPFLKAILQCSRDGSRVVLDEKLNENTAAHTLIRRVAVNPVTGTSAVAVVVLAIVEEARSAGASYGQVARALAQDYVDLYYVNLDTEEFIEYSPVAELEDLAMERHGDDFFAASRRDARLRLYAEDQESFVKVFTKQNVVKVLDTEGQFKLSYRLMIDGEPRYVGMKAVRLPGDRSHMIVGVINVDEQMRQKEALTLVQAEKTVYTRLSALMQNTICIYTVDPVTGHYSEFRASSDYAGLGIPREGEDFFVESLKECERVIYPQDLPKVQMMLNREKILEEVGKHGVYTFRYRLMINGSPRYVNLKAARLTEYDRPVLVIGINDVDAQMRREREYERKLVSASQKANLDTLTGVKNKIAYRDFSEYLSRQIEEGQSVEYAVVLCRVNDLDRVNAAQGRAAGDQLIRDVCAVVCNTFVHCPVFRVAGDQFAVIARGESLRSMDSLIARMAEACRTSSLSVSYGMAKYDGGRSAAAVFAEAERRCLEE